MAVPLVENNLRSFSNISKGVKGNSMRGIEIHEESNTDFKNPCFFLSWRWRLQAIYLFLFFYFRILDYWIHFQIFRYSFFFISLLQTSQRRWIWANAEHYQFKYYLRRNLYLNSVNSNLESRFIFEITLSTTSIIQDHRRVEHFQFLCFSC